ncbi:o-succinylbenzoate synthase [Herbiconiux sp. KACC 21604]|uniref:o-succinylbenzoate synthase n=1 Tax=unclassified Herbiconiux TaxID=2618217 RepID=UPI001490B17D|nr:o-succinylbenzoate synthase [Herbiconiux sp. SALV-R1]QJU52236.1 o-succinylbenzoate synthase [Herbiconiux sp. SALV-R1]WPO87081.1 o-succinylbenzoate synthase [Herbiconiux sp. KACC 21604]
MTSAPPALAELLERMHVVALPLHTRFRGQTVREIALFEGPQGWTEFSPFPEYDDEESAAWLRAAVEFGWAETAAPDATREPRTEIPVNATVPAVEAADVDRVLSHYDGCRTAKVKVAERGQTLDDDVARVRRVREVMGLEGRIRVDANGGWNVDEAEHAVHRLAEFDLEYLEQPCASVDELAQLRERVAYLSIPVAADESVRKASDPLAVARAGAADLLVVKAQPLGGVTRALALVAEAGLPAVVSSALESSVGIAMGAHLAAALPSLDHDCGLATVELFTADVAAPGQSLVPRAGRIPVTRPDVDPDALARLAATPDRRGWWAHRVTRIHPLL